MTIIGVTGSRQWDSVQQPRIKLLCRDLVVGWKQHDQDVCFHVGDAAGVDSWLLFQLIRQGVPGVVYGVNNRWRSLEHLDQEIAIPASIERCSIEAKANRGMYIVRDKALAQSVSVMYGIWNGQSRGTIHTLNFAQEAGATCYIWTYRHQWQQLGKGNEDDIRTR